ncbi:phosphoadenylylsulfate reductase (thioredoxin) [Persephonella hydrogeniphila]|uniref:Adenosine 5'-phosphosulfate reductase n=1 Tax=Persephonella hydrogeniphila TaxID=198703 RepID=A0A285NPI4_9AQUI|nr:phosphoadenylyl-sulfate reductase [Persephonella hydrogeniphila]SNZ11440.1 phosphoadenylylsulfate reductase (thioredoxin) [Persephonella hydrogeniphila]
MFTREFVKERSEHFEKLPAQELLKWVYSNFKNVGFTSSFSADDVSIIHMIKQIKPDALIIFIDTDFHFPETYELVEKIKKEWDINLKVIKPEITVEEQDRLYGEKLYEKDPDKCCFIRKVEPLKKALNDLDVWITGMRRDQSPTRANIGKVETHKLPDGRVILKVNPIADWTRKDVWKYVEDNNLPYNPLYDRNYLSIGCAPCTRPVSEGEDERAGRWAGKGKLECGLHTFTEKE